MSTVSKYARVSVAAVAAGGLMFGTAACGSSSGSGSGGSQKSSSSSSKKSMPKKSSSGGTMSGAMSMVGPGCKAYAKKVPSGSGSVQGMAQDKVTTAASNNPLLKQLTASVSGKLNPKVNLVDALNGGQYTVFAPVDSAFAKLPKATVKKLQTPAGAATLKKVLTYHVIQGQLAPSRITGSHKSLEGAPVKVTGSGNHLKVDGQAGVICGGVKTANATVYLIDSVLMPPMGRM